jgi:putative chitinase
LLQNPKGFFDHCRSTILGPDLSTDEVEGCEAILKAMTGSPVAYAAYALATAFHETNHTMQPVKELGGYRYLAKYDTGKLAAALGNTPEADGDGQLYAGRGYVQLTGKANYAKAGLRLNLPLAANPDLALQPGIAGDIMRQGMELGWFTGKRFASYLPSGPSGALLDEFRAARRIINGTDRANLIAGYAVNFQLALFKGSWE